MVVDSSRRTRVNPFTLGELSRTFVAVTIGQSLMANYVGGEPQRGGSDILQVNVYDGALYVAEDPLLGVDTFLPEPARGNFAIRLGRRLLATGRHDRVIIVPIAVGGSHVAQWAAGGLFHPRIAAAGHALRALGLEATAVLWQQGATDNSLDTSAAAYAASLRDVIATFRGVGFAATPFLVA